MKCSDCGATVSRRAKYCGQCGVMVQSDPTAVSSSEIKEYAKELVSEGQVAAGEIRQVAKKAIKSETGKSVLIWGAFGAVAGAALPFVGAAVLGALGAGYGALKKL